MTAGVIIYIIAHIETLTEERRKEFAMYLRNNGGTI